MPFINATISARTKKANIIRMSALLLCLVLLSGCAVSNSVSWQRAETEAENSVFSLSADTSFISELPSVSAKAAILIDGNTGKIIGVKNADARMSMASTTKIMTALVAIESCDISTTVAVSPDAVGVEGSSVYLYNGERLSLEDLLYAMLLESANDAAAAIAIAVGGSIEGFAEMMNQKAEELGLENTHFTNPHGLDNEEHYTTARELAIIAGEALKNDAFRKIVSTYKKDIPLNETEGVRLLINHNKLLKLYDGSVGVKTGYTKKSGRCLVSAAERDGLFLICVTLNAPDDWKDHQTLLDYGFSLYESRILCLDGEYRHIMPIVGGDQDYVVLTNNGDTRVTLPRGANDLQCSLELSNFEYAPIKQGDICGNLIYTLDGKEVARIPLYAQYSVDRATYKKNLWTFFTSVFGK